VAQADEPWDLWEERIAGKEPLRMVFVARFPSSRACQAQASALWTSPSPAGVTRLGYMCLPAEPSAAPAREPDPASR
jgi:hypothetical protein